MNDIKSRKIFVVTHKEYSFPQDSNSNYAPIKVGNVSTDPSVIIFTDSSGDNIAHLNSSFCELTALYWIWKNVSDDVVGLVHYRRYFKPLKHSIILKDKKIASSDDFDISEQGYDVIVAKPRNYVVATIEKHYKKAHHAEDFDLLRQKIKTLHPNYLQSFDKVMLGKKLSLYNMFVGKKAVIDQYCQWLFNILFALEKEISYQEYDSYQKRIFGFMAERLFNVWLEKHKNEIKISYRSIVNIEGEPVVKKGINFIKRQFL